jgi:hypothetical protein
LWDSDKGNKDDTRVTNRRLLRLVGAREEDYPSSASDTFACFEDKLETTLRAELGEAVFDAIAGQLQSELEVPSTAELLKKPTFVSELIRRATYVGSTAKTLELILEKILTLQQKSKPGRTL